MCEAEQDQRGQCEQGTFHCAILLCPGANDPPENLPKKAPGQVTFGQLEARTGPRPSGAQVVYANSLMRL